MRVGIVTVDGGQVGSVTQTVGYGRTDTSLPPLLSSGETSKATLPHTGLGAKSAYGGVKHYSPGPGARNASSRGNSPSLGDVPRTSRGNPFDRSRFEKELADKPWLREKIAHVSVGENTDPRANLAVIESMMNRAAVRGTTLEKESRRHAQSGRDEGGYYAGYAPHVNDKHRAMFERNMHEALSGSNITNYATDNSSGDLARRERASGAFVPHGPPINGESFFSPGHREPVLRNRWQEMYQRAQTHEQAAAHPDPSLDGLVPRP